MARLLSKGRKNSLTFGSHDGAEVSGIYPCLSRLDLDKTALAVYVSSLPCEQLEVILKIIKREIKKILDHIGELDNISERR